MDAPPRVPLFLLLAVLAIAAALYGGWPRRSSWDPLVTGSLPRTDLPVNAGAGPLSIPNAALEPVGWGDLDGWASDDHAAAFATFNASCHAIVRAVVFRAESATNHAADPRSVRAALEPAPARSKPVVWNPRPHGSSSRPISFRSESAGSEIPQALSLVITIRSSMAHDFRLGNSRCLCTAVLVTWQRSRSAGGARSTERALHHPAAPRN